MPHQEFQKRYLDLGINLEWPNAPLTMWFDGCHAPHLTVSTFLPPMSLIETLGTQDLFAQMSCGSSLFDN